MVCPLRRWRWFERLLGRMEPVWEPTEPVKETRHPMVEVWSDLAKSKKTAKKRTKKARKKK